MQSVTHHQDFFFVESPAIAVEVVKSEVEHLGIGFAEVDEFFVDDAFYQFGDCAGGYGHVIFGYGVEVVGIGYDDRHVLFADQVDGFVDVVVPVKALIVEENHGFDVVEIVFVKVGNGHTFQVGLHDVMGGVGGAEVGHLAPFDFEL